MRNPASFTHDGTQHFESTRTAIGKALDSYSQERAIKPVAGLDVEALAELTESSYIDLVRWAGLQAHPEKRGKLSAAEEAPPQSLWSVANHPREWMRRVQGTESRYFRAIGSAEALMMKAADLGQRWMKGVWATSRTRSYENSQYLGNPVLTWTCG